MTSRKGRTEPRIFTPPLRELTPETTLGYDVAEWSADVLGIVLLPWEKWLFIHALEIIGDFDGEWRFRFRTVIVLVARQNGKSVMGMVLSLFFLYVLGAPLVLGTAQDLDQATEVWEGAVDMAQESEELREAIEQIYRGNGNKMLKLEGRRRYKVAAATRKGTRGKTSNLVLMDEIREHQNFQAWSAASKTIKAVRNGIVWCMSNAGDGSSVVLRHLRIQAHKAIGDPDGIVKALEGTGAEPDSEEEEEMRAAMSSIGLFEWSAPPDCDKWDRDAWACANPSMGYGFLDESTIASDCATDPEQDFRIEDLCQWVTAAVTPPFPAESWQDGIDDGSFIAPDSPLTFGVDVSEDRSRASIAVCGLRPDRSYHGELIAYRVGVGWLQGWFAERAHEYNGMRVALQVKGAPVSAFADILGAVDGVEIVPCQGADVAGWCGRLWDAVAACSEETESDSTPIYHLTQPRLDLAANVAATRPLGDGAWAWDRKKSLEDISPLVALTMAFGAATAAKKEKRSVYEDGADLMIL